MENDVWTVLLAVVNMTQVVLLAWINARQAQLHNRINGGIDRWEQRRRARAEHPTRARSRKDTDDAGSH